MAKKALLRYLRRSGILPRSVPINPGKCCLKWGIRIALLRRCHYNAHAIYRPAWKHRNPMRHKPPVSPMDVAFLVPEACDIESVMQRVLVAQIGVGAVLAVVLWSKYGDVVGYSALLGSLVCVIPNAFLALRLAVPRRDPGAEALVRAAYIGELGKLALTVLLFGLVFTLVEPLSAAALFAGFVATQLVTLAGLLMQRGQEQDTSNSNGS